MSDQLMGVDYFALSVDAKDDDKIFELKYRYGMPDGAADYDHAAAWAAYGRFVELLASIYQEGFAAQMTNQKRLRLSQQLGMPLGELDRFILTCVDVGLFDDRMWNEWGVLTSRGIQRRYFHAVKRRKGSIPPELSRYLLIDVDGDACSQREGAGCASGATDARTEQAATDDDACTEQACAAADADTMHAEKQQRKEKKRKEEKTKEKKMRPIRSRDGGTARTRASADSGPGSSLSKIFEARAGRQPKARAQPYPLSCLSAASAEGRYGDGAGGEHDAPWDALVAHLRHRSPDCDVGSFAARVADACPPECPETPECVSQCFRLISQALDKFDRSVCASPIPLVLKVLDEDRRGDPS